MFEIRGKYNTALCFAEEADAAAVSQITALCNMSAFAQCKIRIMPDVHAASGCTVGTAMTLRDRVAPAMVGVDIGCGMETVKLAEREIDFAVLDKVIRNGVPSGAGTRVKPHPYSAQFEPDELYCRASVEAQKALRSIGTLGGGNHFIEIDRGEDGSLYLVIHSGSRMLGKAVADHYRALAARMREEYVGEYIPPALACLEGRAFDEYIHDMKLVQRFAHLNRTAIAEVILSGMGLSAEHRFSTVHNYIDTDSMILRKGAISAEKGEIILIPLNMRDGALICRGKGNEDWNRSAPHGAGRRLKRGDAKAQLSLGEYAEAMQGIYTTCVSAATLDESPMAYKDSGSIESLISPAAEVISRLKPVYNFKAK